jgi:hypothetical protein
MKMMVQFETVEQMRERIKPNERFIAVPSYGWHTNEKRRAVLEENGTVFVFGKGKRRYGNRFSDDYFIRNFACELLTQSDESEKWERQIKNIVKKLNASGLWTEIKEMCILALDMGYDEWKEFNKTGSAEYYDVRWNKEISKDEKVERCNAIFDKDFSKYIKRFPNLFYKDEDGYNCVHRDNDGFLTYPKTKSMYFGKYWNKDEKKKIAEHMNDKTEYKTRQRVNYDVSFHYDPKLNKAWYSEEYRDCGNGHYYLAIDGNTALFYEDD